MGFISGEILRKITANTGISKNPEFLHEGSRTDRCYLRLHLHPVGVALQEVAADAQVSWSQVKGEGGAGPILSDLSESGEPVCKESGR